MRKPVVALVGRPNVGKSTLFNRLANERLAVVDDIPGTTRDRLMAEADWTGIIFNIIDTGGIDPTQMDVIGNHDCNRPCEPEEEEEEPSLLDEALDFLNIFSYHCDPLTGDCAWCNDAGECTNNLPSDCFPVAVDESGNDIYLCS